MTMNTTDKLTLSEQRLNDLLCGALEGGSNYWYYITSHNKKEVGAEYYSDIPFKEGGYMNIIDIEDDEDFSNRQSVTVNRAKIEEGHRIFKEKYPHHYYDALTEGDDATTADVFFQCVVWGDVIYG